MVLGLHGISTLEFGSIDAILGCVAAGVGITLLPRTIVENAMRSYKLGVHTLPPEQAAADTLFVRRRDAYLTSALAAFVRTVLDLSDPKVTPSRLQAHAS